MIFYCKSRGLESIHRVTGSAFAAIQPLGELTVVWIGLVAVHALLKGQRFLEISAKVAL